MGQSPGSGSAHLSWDLETGAAHLPSPPTVVGGPCLLPPFPMSISRLPPPMPCQPLTRGSQANIQIKNCWVRVSLSLWIMALGGWVHSTPFQSHPVPTLDSPALTGHPQRAAASLHLCSGLPAPREAAPELPHTPCPGLPPGGCRTSSPTVSELPSRLGSEGPGAHPSQTTPPPSP